MITDKIYAELIQYGGSILYGSSLTLTAGDLINEAFLKWEGDTLDIAAFKKLMRAEAAQEKMFQSGFTSLFVVDEKGNSITRDLLKPRRTSGEVRCCRSCNEIKPLAAFRFIDTTKDRPYSYHLNQCIECEQAHKNRRRRQLWAESLQRANASKTDEHIDPKQCRLRELWIKANRKYHSKPEVRKAQTKRNKSWIAKEKEALTDNYIKYLLRGRDIRTCDITPEMIQEERAKQILKRETGVYKKKGQRRAA